VKGNQKPGAPDMPLNALMYFRKFGKLTAKEKTSRGNLHERGRRKKKALNRHPGSPSGGVEGLTMRYENTGGHSKLP